MAFIVHCRANERMNAYAPCNGLLTMCVPIVMSKLFFFIFPRITNVMLCLLIQKAYLAQCACSYTLVHSLIGIKINKYFMLLLVSRSTVLHGTNKISRYFHSS